MVYHRLRLGAALDAVVEAEARAEAAEARLERVLAILTRAAERSNVKVLQDVLGRIDEELAGDTRIIQASA